MVGRSIGHYAILEKIGEGGMGVVYKARDTRLDRLAAIKVLSPKALLDPERRIRFVQEAKAASALNHPNIITVYDIDTYGEVSFIAMEYVEGRTLGQIIGRRGLRLTDTLKYAAQVADALAAAHMAGIIHRDIKPANIMVSETTARPGLVKVLDFGVAKLTEPEPAAEEDVLGTRSAIDPVRTEDGIVLGSVPYMSPEQAEGRKVDARSDVFSFGAVLYEMATGRRPFSGDTKLSTMAATLHIDPRPASEVVEGIPRELERIIQRCLRKDPARRFQHMDDLKVALEEIKEEAEAGRLIPGSASQEGRKHWPVLLVAAAVVLLAASGAWLFSRPSKPAPPLRVTPLTALPGSERMPSFSPDGDEVAFSWNGQRQNNFDIYVKLVSGASSPLRLTTNPAMDLAPAWSPDGRWIAFIRKGSGGGEVFLISPLGGPERKVTDTPGEFLAWAADGKSLAVADRGSPKEASSVYLVSVTTGERRRLTTPPERSVGDLSFAFSPDGQALAFARWATSSGSDLYVSCADGKNPRRLTRDDSRIYGLAWTPDGREVVFSSNHGGGQNLWRIPWEADGATPERVAGAEGDAHYPAISRPGSRIGPRLAYERSVQDTNIWSMGAGGGPEGRPKLVIASTRTDTSPQFSPDGKRIAFASDRSGSFEIWVCDSQGSNLVQLTSFGGSYVGSPRWSPDGQRLAFDVLTGGNRDIYLVGASGGSLRRLTDEPSEEGQPSWSSDGRFIYFRSNRSGSPQIWKMPAGSEAVSSKAVQITKTGGFECAESADGKRLYYVKAKGAKGLWSVPVEGGEEVLALPSAWHGFWSVTRDGIYFLDLEAALPRPVKFFSFATREISQIGVVEKGVLAGRPGFSVTPDGRRILWAQIDHEDSDLMLVENFR